MQTAVIFIWISTLMFALGLGLFVYYMRTRRNWAWELSVVLLALGSFGLSMLFFG